MIVVFCWYETMEYLLINSIHVNIEIRKIRNRRWRIAVFEMAQSLDFYEADGESDYHNLVAQDQLEYFFHGIEGKSKFGILNF